MSPGKAASQAGHAYKMITKQMLEKYPHLAKQYFSDGIGTNVCLKSKNLSKLLEAHERAKEANIPCELITDSGHIMPPHFTGQPVITALGIGPATREQISHITKRFSVYR